MIVLQLWHTLPKHQAVRNPTRQTQDFLWTLACCLKTWSSAALSVNSRKNKHLASPQAGPMADPPAVFTAALPTALTRALQAVATPYPAAVAAALLAALAAAPPGLVATPQATLQSLP
mmetsp:Transcript_17527/g.40733  ORF Transcript_17527/g.40733 Transcript_17527/m.40733 type:complete len:118 (-) Transcript_17527:608-961(-)